MEVWQSNISLYEVVTNNATASGMGLAVAEALKARGDWDLHLLDLNDQAGKKVAADLSATFHKVNVTDYASLAATFDKVHKANGRLDFVFANAGIVERFSFYDKHDTDGPPPPLNQLSIDINLKAVVDTTYLAQHYFRKSSAKGDKVLVMTSSCGGLYPSPFCPMYSAAKHAVSVTFLACYHLLLELTTTISSSASHVVWPSTTSLMTEFASTPFVQGLCVLV